MALANELTRRGLSAIDPDHDAELSHWEDGAGNEVLLEQLTELFELMKGADSVELKLPDHDEGGARVPRG